MSTAGKAWLAVFLAGSGMRGEIIHIGQNARTGGADAVVVDQVNLVHTAQVLPLDGAGKLAGKGDAAAQIEQVIDNIDQALRAGGSDLSRTIKLNVYVRNSEVTVRVVEAVKERFGGFSKPPVSLVTGELAHPDALVAADAVGTAPPRLTYPVERRRSSALAGGPGTSHAGVLPIGPRMYLSGQAVGKETLAASAAETLKQLLQTLTFLGLTLDHVVQVKSFLKPISQAPVAEKEIVTFFKDKAPPMVFVEWKNAGPIEIELIAMGRLGAQTEGEMIEHINLPSQPASPVFSRVARLRHPKTIYFGGLFADGAASSAEQIRQAFANLKFVGRQAGTDFDHLAKATYYVANDEVSKLLNEIRPEFYNPKHPPAASKASVAGTGVEGLTFTMDMIAVPAK
jgi:enamine deaminase RidA (YjgF/YER057c/UK114 family)